MDAHRLATGRAPLFVEHYPPRVTGGRGETFDLVVFAHYEVREVMRGGIWHKEIGSPSWYHLSRREVEVLVGSPVCGVFERRQRTVHNAQELCAHRVEKRWTSTS